MCGMLEYVRSEVYGGCQNMSSTKGTPSYIPAAGESAQSIAERAAAMATRLEQTVTLAYAGHTFRTDGDQETLLRQLLVAESAPYSSPPEAPPHGFGCIR